jgi:hypothetical protein
MSRSPSDDIDPPQRFLISSRAELRAALLQLLGRAQRRLRLAASDLSVFALDHVDPIAALRRHLLERADNRIQLLVDDIAWLDGRAPRLRNLQRDFSHALLIRCTDAQDAIGEDIVAIGDDRDVLLLQPSIGTLGELWCENKPFAQPLVAAFDRRWEHASHNLAAKPLGL